MCEKCLDLDYPVADCWRPCYVPRRSLGTIPATPRGGFSDEDYDAQHKVNSLMAIIRQQRSEIATLKAVHSRTNSRDSFEGVE